MIFPATQLELSGERFAVAYRLVAENEKAARAKARGICLEQTVEVPVELLADDDIRTQVVGQAESLEERAPRRFDVRISYAIESATCELTQLLNVIFGNSAMQPGIRVLHLDLPDRLLACFPGPRFGCEGIRALLGVARRPLLCTALKPMGLAARDLATLAEQIALGGFDIIKEDHGLADQPFARFSERVGRCAEAIDRANHLTGERCLFVPNITAPADRIVARAHEAKRLGAGGLMVAPGLAGWDALRLLAADDGLALPILSHPAWLGTFAIDGDEGVAHHVIFGQLPRLAGADATIFVNYGGRFAYSPEDCRGIVAGAQMPMGWFPAIFPIPSGGMTLDRLPEMYEFYGSDAIFLIAGGLYAHGPDLLQSARQFRAVIDKL